MNARQQRRRDNGSAIAEFGPALFVLLIIIFFPLMDFLGLAAAYCMGWYCNYNVCRELSVRKENERDQVFSECNTALFNTGLIAFVGCKTHTDTDSTPASPPVPSAPSDLFHHADYGAAAGGFQPIVTLTTQVTAQPFITVPFIPAVPGLSAPAAMVFTSQRPREVTQ